MSKSLKIYAPAAGAAALVLVGALLVAGDFSDQEPAPLRMASGVVSGEAQMAADADVDGEAVSAANASMDGEAETASEAETAADPGEDAAESDMAADAGSDAQPASEGEDDVAAAADAPVPDPSEDTAAAEGDAADEGMATDGGAESAAEMAGSDEALSDEPMAETASTATPESDVPMADAADSSAGGDGLELGRLATEDEVAAWDIDIRPDGAGLPVGSGSVEEGEAIYSEACAGCHGDFGEAIGRWPVLAGGEGTLTKERPVKTIGSYWPYLSTVYDYVHRAMPFGNAQSLSDDEVYALTAYILNLNFIVEDDFVLSNENFTEVTLPNEDGFYLDDRAETEYPQFTADGLCMENCKETVEITARARVIDVTPEDAAAAGDLEGGGNADSGVTEEDAAPVETASSEGTGGSDAAEAEESAAVASAGESAEAVSEPDPELVAAGEKVFRKCGACHQVGDSAKNRSGPQLNGIVGRAVGGLDDFGYSKAFQEANADGMVWSHENLAEFLANPRAAMKGTKMSFAGLKKEEELDAVIAYLETFE